MAEGAARHREDVEQLRRRFAEFRKTHAVRSRLPEELWATAAKLARRDGIEATARALDVDRPSLQKWTDRFEPRVQSRRLSLDASVELAEQRAQPPPSWNCWRAAGATGIGNQLSGGSRIAAGAKLRLELKAISTSQLAELIRAFAAS